MKIATISIFICICFLSVCLAADNGLTLYVDPSSTSIDPKCGGSIDNACTTMPKAYSSYLAQTDGTNTTQLTLQLMDGVYNASVNGVNVMTDNIYLTSLVVSSYSNNSANVILTDSKGMLPFFYYKQQGNVAQNLGVINVTFTNSVSIVSSNSMVSVGFINCVFTNASSIYSPLLSLLVNIGPNAQAPSLNFGNCTISGITLDHSLNVIETQNYTVFVDGLSIDQLSANSAFSIRNGFVTMVRLSMTNSFGAQSPLLLYQCGLSMRSCTFNNNRGNWGGAIKMNSDGNSYDATITTSSFTNNISPNQGGALFISGGNIQLTQSTFVSNSAYGPGGMGGAVYISSPRFTIDQGIFTNNTAKNQGGSLFLSFCGNAYFSGTQFNDNSAPEGGAIYTSGSTVTFNTDSFSNNTAAYHGDQVYCLSSNFSISSIYNTATNRTAYYCPNQDCSFSSSSFKCPPAEPSSSSSDNTHSTSHSDNPKNDDHKKIVIAVCVSIAGVALIAAVSFIIYRRHHHHHHRHRHHHHDHHETKSLIYQN
ncbi:hypothetical protein CYY_007847 [Polysphondylium violaceum]|uniref:Polymorphic outer membrane protein n=1 Tax=Polysphondylium violaceum TaxID=133409 RepID=A0A8J4UXS9_9MYCE|nr:hypothetical protein CYY_007847 [Polysphondylium violaceum]